LLRHKVTLNFGESELMSNRIENPLDSSSESNVELPKLSSLRVSGRFRAVWEGLALGLVVGFADTRISEGHAFVFAVYLSVGALLGLRHAGRACPCWPLLGITLYAAHVAAIACGRTPPYVEENYRFAEQGMWVLIPAGFGLLLGVGVRVALAALGKFRRKSGPPVAMLPKSTREVMIVIASIGLGLGCLHRVVFPPTIYAPGYDGARFRAIREGQSADQVLSALGPPLQKSSWPGGEEMWEYSEQYTYTSNYERRRIYFKNGRVESVTNDYWVD
jgi:hypothetical protein